MIEIPREELDAECGHQVDYANQVSGCVSGSSRGEAWMVCREITTTISDTTSQTATVILQVRETKTVGGPVIPSTEDDHTEVEEYPVQVEFDHSDVPLYNSEAIPTKFQQSDKDWPHPGEAIIPLVKDWHENNPLRIDTSELD